MQTKGRTEASEGAASRRSDEAKPQTATETTTVVGPSIVIRGRLKCAEDLVIKGRVDAEITSSKSLHIENSGIVKANIDVQSVTINGVLVGNITAEKRTEIASDGRVVGDILTPTLVISDGASIRGRIDMPNFDSAARPMTNRTPGKATPVVATEAAPPPVVEPVVEPVVAPEPVAAAAVDDGAEWNGDQPREAGLGAGLRRMLFDDKKSVDNTKGKKRRF